MSFLPDAETLFQHAACGLLLCAEDGTILKANWTFCGWLGYAEHELVGKKKLQDQLAIGGRVFHQTHWRPLMQVQGSVAEVLLDVRQGQGDKLPMLFNAAAMLFLTVAAAPLVQLKVNFINLGISTIVGGLFFAGFIEAVKWIATKLMTPAATTAQ